MRALAVEDGDVARVLVRVDRGGVKLGAVDDEADAAGPVGNALGLGLGLQRGRVAAVRVGVGGQGGGGGGGGVVEVDPALLRLRDAAKAKRERRMTRSRLTQTRRRRWRFAGVIVRTELRRRETVARSRTTPTWTCRVSPKWPRRASIEPSTALTIGASCASTGDTYRSMLVAVTSPSRPPRAHPPTRARRTSPSQIATHPMVARRGGGSGDDGSIF